MSKTQTTIRVDEENYAKAKENYLKSADRTAITDIESLIKIQELFKKLGLNVVENDF